MEAPEAPTAYQFVMDNWLPATIPMKRLAQYMDKLAQLVGSPERVHFTKITKGSAQSAFNVEGVAAYEVSQRLKAANEDQFSEPAKLRKEINKMLRDDGCVAYLRVLKGQKVIEFAGRKTPISEEVIVHDTGDLEGTVIRVGGRGNTIPVTLEGADGLPYRCWATKAIAKQLAPYLFEEQVRVTGKGKWLRNSEGVWNMEEFQILSHAVLEDSSLTEFVKDMREIPGSVWNEKADPQAELKRIRGD